VVAHMRAARVGAQTPVAGLTRVHVLRRRCHLDRSNTRDNHTTTTISRSSLQRLLRLRPRRTEKRASRPARPHRRPRHPPGAPTPRLPHHSRQVSRRPWRRSSWTPNPPHHHPAPLPPSSLKDSQMTSGCRPLGSSASHLDSRVLASVAHETESGTWVPFWRTGVMSSVTLYTTSYGRFTLNHCDDL